ncbi:hypothetical protein TPHA_0D01110 [Tetrapisispora phaffii CBS 4417]|uniref:Mitochondrial adapter protein MCP1 transmembrane domain-containing protein n=1 Tax=Tetrapisispora phaffii (strain ATCC 24235 / CBS 4417 / NBRC 1672 / NRRL Y-8282 / UCD 70-5) TaxID=1071381 RepID=G8BSD1_TETPH|nr:hypothetical protein TPHA_0D01110 [Tetrapisispora phaffii CBS 4417]CCE62752.1 hypothetical protein TPHA_0D01110 [Tetrapisispora phaffii CBS 4417]
MIQQSDLKEVSPQPIANEGELPDDIVKDNSKKKKWLDFMQFSNSQINIFTVLRYVQKTSVYPLAVYFPLHSINTFIVPAISPNYTPNEVLMMVREVLPSPELTTKMLVMSALVHTGSGFLIRVLNLWRNRKHPKQENTETFIHENSQDNSQKTIGLVGGVSGFLLGLKKRFSIPPQVVSGYVLNTALAFHLLIMKFGPSLANIDIDFGYVKWILQNNEKTTKWVFGIVPLATLITSGTYHILAGSCQYLNFKSLSSRRKWSDLITIMTVFGGVSLIRLSTATSDIFGSRNYNAIFSALHLK